MNPIDEWEFLPITIRRRDLRVSKQKFKKNGGENNMGRPHTNIKRTKPMGTHGACCEVEGPDLGTPRQYMQSGPKYNGPNYAQASVTGPLQNGIKGKTSVAPK